VAGIAVASASVDNGVDSSSENQRRLGGQAMEITSMHQFSFDFADPFFDPARWRVGLQVTIFENTYGLDAARAWSPSSASCRARWWLAPAERARPPAREHS